ncbi:MAG: hypothetical protein MRJ96_03655 [Nitrospirales bacterium]|nr:hypothetical protein [Nitrospira sp.]MDR4500534.1 hypothetical protein [Nitrospirales bacterium]
MNVRTIPGNVFWERACLTALIPAFLVLSSCSTAPRSVAVQDEDDSTVLSVAPQSPALIGSLPAQDMVEPHVLSVADRMPLGHLAEAAQTEEDLGPLFSFRAQDMPLVDALTLFAHTNQLNIVAGPDITGNITVNFHTLPLKAAMSALLDAHGYYWEQDGDLIRVRKYETRIFNLDYIRLVRGGTGENKANISSSGGGSAGQGTGEITVNQQDEIKFWEELETQVKSLMSKEGRLVFNRLSGTIQVTDLHQRVVDIAQYLAKVSGSLHRQVEIQARIYEVNLNDSYSLGINWDQITLDGVAGNLVLSNIITAPFGGFVAKAATAQATTTTRTSFPKGTFETVIEALQEQGDLKVISQPRLLTLNNQPALIKVATDQAFFTQTVVQGTGGTGNIVTEQARSVTVGLVLSVTPQISDDGWIMMDVTPIISRLREIATSPQQTATAPILDVKQSSGLVRLKDGEMVIIGGLIQDEVSETERKVPLLGDIPWLGRLFKGTYKITAKSELVIFLQPRIVEGRL